MSNELNPDSNEKKKKNFFNQISPNHNDYNQMNDETISRDFLPSGPDDLATLETTKVQKSGLLSKRYSEIYTYMNVNQLTCHLHHFYVL